MERDEKGLGEWRVAYELECGEKVTSAFCDTIWVETGGKRHAKLRRRTRRTVLQQEL